MLGPVELVDEVDSTNRVLLERAREGAPHGLVLVANHQTAGRGRLGRTWEAAPGAALLVSVLLRPSLPPDRIQLLTLAAGLAARGACQEAAGVTPALKWPNDLVIEDGDELRKLAGLLAESLLTGERVEAVVVGMGLNIGDVALPDGAVALDAISVTPVSRDDLLHTWLAALDARLEPWSESDVLDEYRQVCSTIGRFVHVDLEGSRIEGQALGVDDDGHLVVETKAGVRSVTVGDVVHVRAVS